MLSATLFVPFSATLFVFTHPPTHAVPITRLSRATSTTAGVTLRRLLMAKMRAICVRSRFNSRKLPIGDAEDGRQRLLVRQPVAGQGHSQGLPASKQQVAHFRLGQGTEFVDEADAGVELGVARQPFDDLLKSRGHPPFILIGLGLAAEPNQPELAVVGGPTAQRAQAQVVLMSDTGQRADRHWRARGSGPPATGLSLCTEAAVPCRVEFRLKAERRTVPPSSGTAITVLSRWNE